MMSSKLVHLKAPILNWVIIIFLLILFVTALISEFFQAPINNAGQQDNFKQLVSKELLEEIDTISFKNSIGQFTLSKHEKNRWFISSPRKLPAKEISITHILSSLEKIKITNIFALDKINLTNFSLTQPRFQITLKNSKRDLGSKYIFKFGQKNPLNNSSYMLFSDKKVIFQISNFDINLDTTTFTEYIDSRLFPFSISSLSKITINRYTKKTLQLKTQNKVWIGNEKKDLNQHKTITFITKLTQMRSPLILDHISKEQEKKITRYLSNPPTSVTFNSDGVEHTYHISTVITKIPELKTDLKYYFLIRKLGDKNIYISSKESFSIFYKKERHLR